MIASKTLTIAMAGLIAAAAASAQSPTDVLTFHYDNARLGWNSHETRISPQTLKAGKFGKLWQVATDGLVWGSPLLVHNLTAVGRSVDVLYAATDHNSVYAVDASDGSSIWTRHELARPLSEAQFLGTWGMEASHGILSTPVIDKATHSLYVCGVEATGLRQFYTVWALDLATGATKPGYPVRLKGTDRGVNFRCGEVMQRGALSMVGNRLIIPFGGRGDVPPWRGWVFSMDVRHPSQTPLAVCTSPFTDGAGVWSGGGVSASDNGDLFATTGNGTYDVATGGACAAECVLRLRAEKPQLALSMKGPANSYTPSNFAFLDEQDEDLGGSTVNVLPSGPGPIPNLLFIGGKDGVAYLLNRDRLGGVGGEVQKKRIFSKSEAIYHEGIRSTSAFWDAGTDGRFLFVSGDEPGPNSDHGMVALKLVPDPKTGAPRMVKAWSLFRDFDGPSSPVISSDGDKNGIVWLVDGGYAGPSSLIAFDGLTGHTLWDSARATPKDSFFGGRRFTSPVVVDGRVYVGAQGILCYGFKGDAK